MTTCVALLFPFYRFKDCILDAHILGRHEEVEPSAPRLRLDSLRERRAVAVKPHCLKGFASERIMLAWNGAFGTLRQPTV